MVDKKYYVYELEDPRDGQVFYVGKGTGNRAWQHTRNVINGARDSNRRKIERIRAILDAGHSPYVHIVARYDEQSDALEHEAELIASKTGLTNILARGGYWSITAEEAARRAEERKKRIADKSKERDANWLRSWLAKAEKWPGVTFPGMKNGDEMAEEFLSIVRQLVMPAPII